MQRQAVPVALRVFFRSYAGMTRIRCKGQLDAFSAPYGAPLGMAAASAGTPMLSSARVGLAGPAGRPQIVRIRHGFLNGNPLPLFHG